MMRYLLAFALLFGLGLAAAASAHAGGIAYYPDPVYKKLSPADSSPMDDMFQLAKDGNVRAQFIIGDLYSKGKGGLPKDLKEARHWFEESAMQGYTHSFIRLAALARREKNDKEAWQWYTLAIDAADNDNNDAEENYAIGARKALVKSADMSYDAISAARKSMSNWEDKRDKQLAAEEAAAEKAAKTAANGQKTPQPASKGESPDEQD